MDDVPLDYLSKVRLTVSGKHKDSDRWKGPATAFCIRQRWRKQAEEAFYVHSQGVTVYAGTKAKRAKDAKNLYEKLLSLSDRLAFIEAKSKELESFFVNNVWAFSHLDEARLREYSRRILSSNGPSIWMALRGRRQD